MRISDDNGLISKELRAIIQNTNDLMFVKDKNFVYVESSKSFATDCVRFSSVEDVIGKTDFELFEDKTVAQKYREDDEKLFASGEPMIEFQEIYPDENGKKQVCLTTKYLLRDKDGNPAGIFGQYHDIGKQIEEEIAFRRDINKNVITALTSTYFVLNYLDLKKHTYTILYAMDYTRKMVENCNTIEKGFEVFINTLVKTEFQDKMREFCDSKTIAKRIKDKKQIDCEYLSNVAVGWCRASLFPVEWDEKGEVTHALFTVSSIDENVAQEIEEGISNKKNLQAVFDNVPGGIIMYEWNGKKLKTLRISKYYEDLFGYSMLNDGGGPDFMRVHPDDIDNYKKAIFNSLTKTHYLEYVFRVWNQKQNCYGWTQINAVSKPQPDGTSLVYAMYTDVTEQKIAEQRLKKSNASILAALGAADQFSYEYDPVLHTSTCFTDDNKGYNLGKVIRNYPECFRNSDFMHPDDVELFIETTHKIDKGEKNSHCNIRANKDGIYHWHSCTFDAFYDSEKERRVALLTVVDITPQMMAMRNYEKRLKMITRANEDALCMCDVNLTKNQFSNVQANGIIKECANKANTLDEFMQLASKSVFDVSERQKYCSIFNRESLLMAFEKGNSHIKLEHFYRISETHTEWVETVFDLITDPISGNVVGISYAKSLNNLKLSRVLLDTALEKDYPMAALVYADTGEYYLYEIEKGEYCEHRLDYWGGVYERLKEAAGNQELTEIQSNLTKEKVVTYLDKYKEYKYAFYGIYHGKKSRLEARFRYADKKHGLIIATLRNITDSALYQQYKHDSEHDSLTGLLNRSSLFMKCRKLLNKYPDKKFAILHCDIRHFHLYNTFFGEKAGDELLCKMAQLIECIGKDYDYWAYGRIEADIFCAFFPIDNDIFEKHIHYLFDEISKIQDNFPIEPIVGVYMIEDSTMPIEAMFTRATIAAKTYKNNMFGLISQFDEIMEQDLKDIHQITSEMHAAVATEQFEVYLQPKYSLRSEKLVGAEALVRWKHPERGMISPGKFIPAFEKNGFISELDRYMWEHVCRILQKWNREGKPMFPISVNMSRVSMHSQATVPFLKSLINKYDIDPQYLELELTESAYMDNPDELKRMLEELQSFGFKILMDDFGSGYSSLNTLRELPVDILKLDMKFLSETQNDNRGRAVLSSVVRMSKLLNLPIVAEGVEKREQADYLRSIGCEYVQGFLFARPMPVLDYEQLLRQCENKKQLNIEEDVKKVPLVLSDTEIEDHLISLGILEYADEKFAYLRTNKQFLTEFDLIENLKPASKVFREHLDDKNYKILLESFARCSDTKKDNLFCICWLDNNNQRKYYGRVHFNGNVGNYADLSVVFLNVTGMEMIGFE